MKLVNYTPHTINLYNQDNELIDTLPPSGYVARVDVNQKKVNTLNGIPVYKNEYLDVVGMDNFDPVNEIPVVSSMVLSALKNKFAPYMVVSPDTNKNAVRDLNGQIIGTKAWITL